MKVIHHVILFMFTGGLGNIIWFIFFRHPKKSFLSDIDLNWVAPVLSGNSINNSFHKPLSEYEINQHLNRNAPPEFEYIINQALNPRVTELNELLDNYFEKSLNIWESKYESFTGNEDDKKKLWEEHSIQFSPEGISLCNEMAPYINRPDLVYPQPKNGMSYSIEELNTWTNDFLPIYTQATNEHTELLNQWNEISWEIARSQVLADKMELDLLMSEANLKINAASFEEQRRHNLAMEAAAIKTSQPKSNPRKSSFLGGAMRGLGNLAAANYNMVQEHQNKPVVYKCFSCKQMKTFSTARPSMKCCGRNMVRQY